LTQYVARRIVMPQAIVKDIWKYREILDAYIGGPAAQAGWLGPK